MSVIQIPDEPCAPIRSSCRQKRGYHCILLRDCTNGMETHETHDAQIYLGGCIAFLEQTGVYTLTSEKFVAALTG